MKKIVFLFAVFCLNTVVASDPEIVDVNIELTSSQKYNIAVTIKHDDTGWDHFANAWKVYSPDGELIAERVLHHPHVKEQPFTRSLRDVFIPPGLSEIVIVANCSVTNEAKKSYKVKLR